MTDIKRVIFEPYNQSYTKVTAEIKDGETHIVYLDNISAKHFLQMSLHYGSFTTPGQI